MKSADVKRVLDAVAWNIYSKRPDSERISLGSSRQDRELVERDWDLLGVREFTAKYLEHIHAPPWHEKNIIEDNDARRAEERSQRS